MVVVLVFVIALMVVIPAVALGSSPQGLSQAQRVRRWVNGLTLFNLIVLLMCIGMGLLWLFAPPAVQAAGPSEQERAVSDPYASLAAALAAGVACIGAGLAVSSTGSAAIGTIAERPEAFGRALIFVGLAEGIAIYGLIIAFMILAR
jgi:V/A-type H+-transporting ATPase subunit K